MVILKHDLIVDVSQNNFTLMVDKRKLDKKGNPVYETLGYYNTLAGAVYGARDYCIRKSLSDCAYDLPEAIKEIKRITAEFVELLQEKMGE